MARRTRPEPPSEPQLEPQPDEPHAVTVHLDEVLADRGMTPLARVCRVLDCQPGDILRVE